MEFFNMEQNGNGFKQEDILCDFGLGDFLDNDDASSTDSMGSPQSQDNNDQTQEQMIQRRNARERRRVEAVNGAFSRLRRHIPYENRNKRLSKVKTLNTAINYINYLSNLLNNVDQAPRQTPKPVSSNGGLPITYGSETNCAPIQSSNTLGYGYHQLHQPAQCYSPPQQMTFAQQNFINNQNNNRHYQNQTSSVSYLPAQQLQAYYNHYPSNTVSNARFASSYHQTANVLYGY